MSGMVLEPMLERVRWSGGLLKRLRWTLVTTLLNRLRELRRSRQLSRLRQLRQLRKSRQLRKLRRLRQLRQSRQSRQLRKWMGRETYKPTASIDQVERNYSHT